MHSLAGLSKRALQEDQSSFCLYFSVSCQQEEDVDVSQISGHEGQRERKTKKDRLNKVSLRKKL